MAPHPPPASPAPPLPPAPPPPSARGAHFPEVPSRGAGADEAGWYGLIERLWNERDALVEDFLRRFSTVSYGSVDVPPEDVRQVAADTMEMFLFQLADRELPTKLRELPRQVAARRAQQGVPIGAFLEAVRHDFRVLWKGLERVAGEDSAGLLVANMDRLLDTVEGYVTDIQQAFVEEEALLARDKQLYRQRLMARLFAGDTGPEGAGGIAQALGLATVRRFELLAVAPDASEAAQRNLLHDRRIHFYELDGTMVIFREWRQDASWEARPPGFDAGYVGHIGGLAEVPRAAATARTLLEHRHPGGGLATVATTWRRVADALLENALPGYAASVTEALDRCTAHERQRLLEVARSYARTGSIKRTAEELYCHRNTVVNRLHALKEEIGLDLTVPDQSALALVVLSGYAEPD